MNLRSSSRILMVASLYMLLYKLIFTFVPFHSIEGAIVHILKALSFAAFLSIILFIGIFIKEYKNLSAMEKRSLFIIALFTILITILRIPSIHFYLSGPTRKILFNLFRLINSIVFISFLISFFIHLGPKSFLKKATRLLIIGVSLSVTLNFLSIITLTYFQKTGAFLVNSPILQIISLIVFIYTTITLLIFLSRISKAPKGEPCQ